MKRYIAHLRRELLHKWYVFRACWRLGVPWLGLIHDWSKFTPAEFIGYAKNYYTPDGRQRPRDTVRLQEYAYALLHHLNNNKHHPQYWMLYGEPQPIPDRYRREMLGDWHGYEVTNGVPTKEYYLRVRHRVILHPETKTWVEEQLGVTDEKLDT